MTDATLLPFDLPAVHRKKLTVDFDGGNQSSDAGLLLLREAERKIGVCRRLANAMPDRRDQSRIRHEMFELVAARFRHHVWLQGRQRPRPAWHDPLMKVAVGRCPESGGPLASTISRLENAPTKTEAARLTGALIDQFCVSVTPEKVESLDIDDTFCAVHGGQQLALWNGHEDERGFSLHIFHVASFTPVVEILRSAKTVRTVIKHVTRRIRRDQETRLIRAPDFG
jgi:Transposase DDE domain group 1